MKIGPAWHYLWVHAASSDGTLVYQVGLQMCSVKVWAEKRGMFPGVLSLYRLSFWYYLRAVIRRDDPVDRAVRQSDRSSPH
jgi:hypothetical protein